MLEASRPLLLIGGGKMGEALLAGWLAQGVPADAVLVVEPAAPRREALTRAYGIAAFADATALPGGCAPGVLLLAVKPQVMDAALPTCAHLVAADTLVLSIAAGKPIGLFERAFGAGSAVVRAMPNTPAAVGRGVTVLCANAAATPGQRTLPPVKSVRRLPLPLRSKAHKLGVRAGLSWNFEGMALSSPADGVTSLHVTQMNSFPSGRKRVQRCWNSFVPSDRRVFFSRSSSHGVVAAEP